MDREKLMDRVHDLQSRMKSAYTEVMKHVQETVDLDYSSILEGDISPLAVARYLEDYIADTNQWLNDCLARHNATKGRRFTNGSFYLASTIVEVDGEMTLSEYIKENASRSYQDSLMIDSLGESDDFIMSLIDELEADYNLDEARIEQEFSNFEELIEDTRKAAESLQQAYDDIELMNEDLYHEFRSTYAC